MVGIFADEIFKSIFVGQNIFILILISPKFVPMALIELVLWI